MRLVGMMLLVVVAAAMVAGCGSSSPTALQEAEEEYLALNEQIETKTKAWEKKSDEYDKAYEASSAMNEEQVDAIYSGNMSLYRKRQPLVKKAGAETEKLANETEELLDAPNELENKADLIANRIEGMKGCDKSCQAERDRAVDLNSKCALTLAKQNGRFQEAEKLCDERYPIPRENILHLESE